MQDKTSTSYFGTYRIIEQQKLRRACANAQICQGIFCLHTQSRDIEQDLNKSLDFSPLGTRSDIHRLYNILFSKASLK